MKPKTSRRFFASSSFNVALTASSALVLFSGVAGAQTWNGSGGDNNWGSGANWGGGVAPLPSATTDISFGGSTRLTPSNNYTAYDDFRNILFNAGAGAFTLSGSAIDLFGKIENSSTTSQTVSFTAIALNSATANEFDPTSGNLTINSADIYTNGNQLKIFGTNTLTFGTGSIISQTGSVAINAAATVIYQSAHTYSGDTFINAGSLQFASGGSANSSTIRLGDNAIANSPSGTVSLTSASGGTTVSSPINVRSNLSGTTGTRTISGTNTSGTNTFSGVIALDAPATVTSTSLGGILAFTGSDFQLKTFGVLVNGAGNTTISGPITSTGAGNTLTKDGTGSLTLTGLNTYNGITTISGGILQLGNGGTSGALATTGTIANNGNLTINRSDAMVQGTNFSTAAITGFGSLTQAGAGTTTLNAANSYAGGTTISAGVLQVGSSSTGTTTVTNGPVGTGTLTLNGGTTLSSNSTTARTINNNLSLGGNVTLGNATNTGTLTFDNTGLTTKSTVLTADTTLTTATVTNSPIVVSIANAISGGFSLTKAGPTGLTLSNNANSYTGATSIAQGTLILTLNGNIGTSGASVIGNNATALVLGTTASNASNLTTFAQFNAGNDSTNYTMSRGIDLSQSTSTGGSTITFQGDSIGGLNTNTLTLAGDINLGAATRTLSIRAFRQGQTVNITGNVSQTSGTGNFNLNTTPQDNNVDGRGVGTIRFSNLARTFVATPNLLMGTAIIDGVVGALATNSPIGQNALNLTQGNSGNIVGGGNFQGVAAASRDNGLDTLRNIFLESAGSSYARIITPGNSSSTTPTNGGYSSAVSIMNGYQLGGLNTTGTITYSGAINPGDVQTGNSATNVMTTGINMALMAEGGGTSVFSGQINDTSSSLTNARVTINQFRNNPHLDGVNNSTGNINGSGTATAGPDGLPDATANQLVGTAKTGTVVLSGANSFVGTVEILGGTLQLGNTTALGFGGRQSTSTGTTTVSTGSVLDLSGSGGASGISEPIILNGTGISSGGALTNNSVTTATIGSGIAGIQIGSLAGTGAGYSTAPTVNITGTGTGATATSSLGLTTASLGTPSGGTGWVVGDTVNISGGGGAGATAKVTAVSAGAITALVIDNPGSGYTAAPTGFTKNTSTAGTGILVLTGANATNFTVTGVTLTAAGTGYTGTPTYTFGSGNATPGTLVLSSVTLATDSSVGGTGDTVINAVVSDAGAAKALTKVGAGKLTLAGANTYTGATTITTGTLQLGNAGTTGSLATASTITNNGNLTVNRTDAVVQGTAFSGAAISGSGSFTQAGTGTTTLNAANTYAGITTIAAGTLNAGIANGAGTGAFGNGGNITFTGGALQHSAVSAATDFSSRIKNSSGAIAIDTNAQSVAYASVLDFSNAGGLTKLGTGTLTLSGNNTFTGAIGITNGTLNLGSAQTGTGGPLGGTGTVASIGTITFGTGANNGTLQFSASNNTDYSSRIGSTANQNFNIDTNGQSVTFASALTPSSGGTLTKLGTGTLTTTSSSNSYSGGTTITSGTLSLGNGGSAGKLSTTGAIVNNGTLLLNRTAAFAQGIDFSSAPITGTGSIILNNVTNSYAQNGLTSANTYSGTTTIRNGFLNVGSNSITSGANGPLGNATSAIILGDAGTLATTYNPGAGDGPNVALFVSGTGSTAYSITRDIDSSATANVAGRSDIGFIGSGTGTLTVSSNWALSTGSVRQNGLYAGLAGQTLDFTGVISGGNSTTGLRAGDWGQGLGVVRLSNASNNYTSQTYVSGGTLLIAGNAAAGSGVLGAHANLTLGDFGGSASALTDGAYAVGKTIILRNITNGSNTWTLGGNTANASSFSGNITPDSLGFSPTLNLSQVASGTTTFAGVIAANPNATFLINVAKIGAGTVVLQGNNSYDGTTTVSAGTLSINGNQSTATGAVNVNSTGTLKGTGTIGGAVTISGLSGTGNQASHAAGNSVGLQTVANDLTYGQYSIFEWELASNTESGRGTNFDAVDLTGVGSDLTIDETANTGAVFKVVLGTDFNGGDAFWLADRKWDVFHVAGTDTTQFKNFQLFNASAPTSSLDFSTYGAFTYTFASGSGSLNWSAVPEPTSALAGLLIGAGLLRRRRA